MADETVRTKFELDASQVLQALRKLDDATDTMQVKQRGLYSAIQDLAKKTGREYEDVAKQLEKIARLTKDTVFTIGRHSKDVTREVFAGARQEKLGLDIDKLFGKQQGRNLLGQFTDKNFPDFRGQLKSLSDYNAKLQLVQKTIEVLARKTGSSFKDVGAQLQKAFPELKNTNLVAASIDNLSKKATGLATSFRSLKETATQVDLALTKIASSGKLALAGNQQHNLQSVVNAFKEVKKNNPGASFEQIAAGMRRMGVDGAYVRAGLKQVNEELVKTGKNGKNAFDRVFTAVNAVRIALGAVVSMLLFSAIQAIGNTFRTAIENLRETELAVYNLINAERKLSELGIDITPKGLQEIIDGVRELVPILSKIDAEELVARIASNVAPSLKLTREELEKLTKAVALAYVQNKALGYSFDEIEKSFTDSVLTGKVSQGINKYGVKIDDLIIKQHAVAMGLVESEEAFDALGGEMKSHVQAVSLIDYAYQEFSKNASSIPEYMKTTDAAIEVANKTWSDLLTTIGQLAAPFILEFLNALIDQLISMNDWLVRNEGVIKQTIITISGLFAGMVKLSEISERGFFEKLDAAGNFKEFIQSIKDGMDRAKESAAELENALDTPTGNPKIVPEVDNEEAMKALEDLEQKIQDIMLDAKHAQEDLDIKLGQKQEDLDLEYIRKADDAATDHAHKIEDINQDTLDKIEDAKRKAREEEEKREQDLLQKLKELRERYLLDLEDALHERDARAVLRLMKEYKLDKQNILDRAALDESQRKDDLAAELQQIEEERRRKIESENIEYQRKLADLATAKAREQEELKVWYQREQEDIKRNIEQKLESLLAGYITEEKLHEEHQGKIYAILSKYFGKDMELMGNLTAFMAQQFAQMQAMVGYAHALGSLGGSYSPRDIPRSSGGGNTTGGRSPRRKMATGGQFVATRPTTLDVGEGGMPELVSVIPLSKLLGGSLGVNSGGSGGLNGSIEVAVTLSPDLEGRIIESAMDGVGEVIGKVNRSK